jgi:hypothetical protein
VNDELLFPFVDGVRLGPTGQCHDDQKTEKGRPSPHGKLIQLQYPIDDTRGPVDCKTA